MKSADRGAPKRIRALADWHHRGAIGTRQDLCRTLEPCVELRRGSARACRYPETTGKSRCSPFRIWSFRTATSETSAALTHPPHEVRASKNRLLAQQSFRPPHQGVNVFRPFLDCVALLLFVFVLLIDTRDAGLRACDMSE